MLQVSSPSMNQMASVLDNAPVAVYVSALDTHELLYANRLARDLFPERKEGEKMTCYEAAGYDRPCSFCKIGEMKETELLVREFCPSQSDAVYQMSGKLIDWDGRVAHIEYVLDITVRKREEEQTRADRDKLKDTFGSIPCGLSVYSFDGARIRPLFHNGAFYEIMGYSEENVSRIEQETTFLGVHPDDLGALQDKIEKTIRTCGVMRHTYRVFNDRAGEYRWIRLEGSVKDKPDGTKLLYGVYSDVSSQKRLERELEDAGSKMQDIINAIPGGVAIYKVSDRFETVYFSDGVPELSGYTVEEYREFMWRDAAEFVYGKDKEMVVGKAREAIRTNGVADFEFRKMHRDGHIVWVRVQMKPIGEQDGLPLLHCVFHNITALKETQLEKDRLINSIPGGIAIYEVKEGAFVPAYFSDGVMRLSGHGRAEYEEMTRLDAMDIIYKPDRLRVLAAAAEALGSGELLDVSYRVRHKEGHLIWVHLNGRLMGAEAENDFFYAVITGMSPATRMFQSITNKSVDGIYVIARDNYDLLYANESVHIFMDTADFTGRKCYEALAERDRPCERCAMKGRSGENGGQAHIIERSGRYFSCTSQDADWNGIRSCVQYVRDVTDEVLARKEKERLELYFRNVVTKLPGGVSVMYLDGDGRLSVEYSSDNLGYPKDREPRELVHPADLPPVMETVRRCVEAGGTQCEFTCRIKKDGGYIWVKSGASFHREEDGGVRIYSVYSDITGEVEEKERIRRQYKELLFRHYSVPEPNALIIGHCNITRGYIIEIIDYTEPAVSLLEQFGTERETFFTGLSGFIVDEKERRKFLDTYLEKPELEAFARGEMEQEMDCFIKLPQDRQGRYARIRVNLVLTPDTGDVTGILTITDITEQVVSERIVRQLSVANYDFVADLNLAEDSYAIVTNKGDGRRDAGRAGVFTAKVRRLTEALVAPRDKERCAKMLSTEYMRERLEKDGSYVFSYALTDGEGGISIKNMMVSSVAPELGRVCLTQTDITESLQERQGLLYMLAYTFELACFIQAGSGRMTMYTREMVLKNLPPYTTDDYEAVVKTFVERYAAEEDRAETGRRLCLPAILEELKEKPAGYDFVFSYTDGGPVRYKQVNVLWGDENRRTVCLVRADITKMLASERRTKKELEGALAQARKANRAKSDFLSAMSHDIRTPMNAIIGMTRLASAYLDDRERVADCLQKISVSSRHLLNLINDVLDMSRIERSKITLNRTQTSLPEMVEQLTDMAGPQAKSSGLTFETVVRGVRHEHFYGDFLRISQILINILSNAMKFTPEGGRITFGVEEEEPREGAGRVRYRFTVKDTGVGMSPEFLSHIFEPFTRSRSSMENRIEGTGLGLSITKGLVELMEGDIRAESLEGVGSVFTVELELERAEAEEGFGAYRELPVFILCAEAEAARDMAEAVKQAGLKASALPDAAGLLEQARGGGLEGLLVLDGALPGDGAALAAEALKRAGADLPVLFLTGYDDVEFCRRAEQACRAYFMRKPFFLSGFYRALEEIFRARKEEGASPDKNAWDGVFKGRRFLMAEDNDINAEILVELLAIYGAEVVAKPDGAQAVEAFKASGPGTYDAVFMDIQMPVMNGYDATRAIRSLERPDAGTIPIIAMTANAFAEDVEAAGQAGMDAHVAKPIELSALGEALERLLKGG